MSGRPWGKTYNYPDRVYSPGRQLSPLLTEWIFRATPLMRLPALSIGEMVLQPGDHKLSTFKDMPLHRAACSVGITLFQRPQYLVVTFDVLLHAVGIHSPRGRIHNVAGKTEIQFGNYMAKPQVVACRLYQGVKFTVLIDPGIGSPQEATLGALHDGALLSELLDRTNEGIVDGSEIIELIVADPLCREVCGEPFKLCSHLIRLTNIAGRGRPDDCAVTVSLRYDTLGFEEAESFADRRATNSKFLSEQLLAKPVAGRVRSKHNLGMNPLDDPANKFRVRGRASHSESSRIREGPGWIPDNRAHANDHGTLDYRVIARR